jgi:hypothetical protein
MNKMQKLLFVVLAVVGVMLTLHINGALAAESTEKATKILKCEIPNYTPGAFEVPGKGFGMVRYYKAGVESQTITVLETVTKPGEDEEGNAADFTFYRFDAMYDKTEIFCGGCGTGHPVNQFPIPPTAYDQFLVEKSLVTCK